MTTPPFAAIRALARLPVARLSARPVLQKSCAKRPPAFRLSSGVAKQESQNAAAAPKEFTSTKKPLYPERLLIYNAGTGKTTWIAFTKLGTIIFFAFGCLVIAPRLHAHPESPWWAAPAAIALTPLPLLITATATSPFVNSIYMHLPHYARSSRQILHRFASSPPPDTRLDIRTVRLNGLWKTTGTTVSELRSLPRRGLGLANLERVPKAAAARAAKGKGRKGLVQRIAGVFVKPRRRFYVNAAEGSRRSAEPGVVELVMKAVAQNSVKQQGRK
ncbi:hypothetical protein GTA08_BOTSDO12804 [Neofusicoccum parvum]|nr:hypothetical protein GTA08_BOTSDO12804 [Neofusicoccum parvum]